MTIARRGASPSRIEYCNLYFFLFKNPFLVNRHPESSALLSKFTNYCDWNGKE